MKKPFARPLLAAVLAGILAAGPVAPLFAQEPAIPRRRRRPPRKEGCRSSLGL